jgi:tRNA-binding EMAP/Myf-like protein
MTASADIDSAACACIGVKDILSAGSNGRMSSDVSQWVSLARSLRSSDLSGLDKSLASKSYLVGNALSIADAAVYVALMTTKGIDVSGYKNVTRFILHVQKMVKSVAGVKALPESTRPTFIPLKLKATSTPAAATKAPLIEGGKKKEEKKEKKGKEGENGGKAAAAPADGGDLNPFLLDIRVGEIVKCWNHPDSEKLLCEEVDLGEEGGPRNIASGIRAHYSAEEFMGKKVSITFRNLTLIWLSRCITRL